MASEQNGVAWELRAARNQALFRAINEELRVETRARDPKLITLACECADADCVETIEVEIERYERTRAEPTHFIVRPGHVYPEVEEVIAEDAGFQIVQKTGEAARVAAAADGSAASG